MRKGIIAARKALTERERQEYSALITEYIRTMPEYIAADTVMLYRSVPGEVCLDGLMNDGKLFAYPVCLGAGEMLACTPEDSSAWRRGTFGIMEPDPARSRLLEPGELGLVICPCVAFDGELHRLGMGGGYYDRFLPKCTKAVKIAAAFECQRADSVPVHPWDVSMDMVVTEMGIIRK